MVLWDGRIYVYGGYDGKKRFGDLYKCCIKNKKYKWKEIQAEGAMPLNRFGHSAVVYQNSMFIFGGWNGHDTMNDIFQYSFLSNYWYEIHRPGGTPPQPRYRHSTVICGSNLYIFGGVDTNQQRFNDVHQFDIEQRRFSKVETSGEMPQPRTFHRAIIYRNVMYIIGGFDGQRLNDMHHVALLFGSDEKSGRFRASGRNMSSSASATQSHSEVVSAHSSADSEAKDDPNVSQKGL